MSYNSNMMTSMETITFPSSLVGDDLSLWSNDLPKNEFQDGASLDTTIQLMDALVACKQDQKSSYITAGDQNDPLPDWMSEKVDVSNWLDVFAGNSANQMNELEMDRMSPVNELLNTFEADESNMSDFFLPKTCLDEEPFMASSPGSSIGSGGSGVNSSVSTMPSSPYSMGSETSEGDSLRETDLGPEDPVSLELLLNSCKDADVFLQLADALPMDLPLPAEGDLKILQETANQMQSDLQRKEKSASKVGRGKSKSKGVTKERRERKKGQNKEAATRYRQKKKKESDCLSSEMEVLEKANGELQGKVSSLEQEIHYLKDLLQEICKVKGQIQILQSP